MSALRAALGIPPDVYKDFAQLRRKVLEKAKAEIDQLAHVRVEWREIRRGRAVTEVEFRFEPKDAPAQISTVDEIERHSAGRKARRVDSVETVIPNNVVAVTVPAAKQVKPGELIFPQGTIRFGVDALAEIGDRTSTRLNSSH